MRQPGASGWEDKEVDFFIDDMSGRDWGSSLSSAKNNVNKGRPQKTRMVDLARLIRARGTPKALGGRTALKMDIEGGEYGVLPALLASGVLCEYVTDIEIEWHGAEKFDGTLPFGVPDCNEILKKKTNTF